MINKKRLDILVCENYKELSREKAKALIMSGVVYLNNQKVDKPGVSYPCDSKIEIRGKTIPYVSRGGLKLEKAIKEFDISLKDKVCIDIGASTGGFTDCMLQNGAKRVYSVDVGYGQLDWKLRNDNRVVNLERTNFRYVTNDIIKEKVDFISVDVSFISLRLILPVARMFMKECAEAVCLIKPQFEAGKDKVGKKGVVKDKNVHFQVVEDIKSFSILNGFDIININYSPIKGPEGNIEYLIYLKKSYGPKDFSGIDIYSLINDSHDKLGK